MLPALLPLIVGLELWGQGCDTLILEVPFPVSSGKVKKKVNQQKFKINQLFQLLFSSTINPKNEN